MLCSVNECGRVVLTRGLCSGHFARLTKTGDIRESVPIREFTKTVEQRFWEKAGLRLVDEIYAATLIEQLTRRLEACADGFSVDTDGRLLIAEARAFLAKLG